MPPEGLEKVKPIPVLVSLQELKAWFEIVLAPLVAIVSTKLADKQDRVRPAVLSIMDNAPAVAVVLVGLMLSAAIAGELPKMQAVAAASPTINAMLRVFMAVLCV